MTQYWIILVLAGFMETGWAVGLKYTEGFTRPVPTTLTILTMIGSVWLLSVAMKGLPLGSAYAVWVGIGAVGTVIAGAMLFQEPLSIARVASVALIIAGIIGLKLSSAS